MAKVKVFAHATDADADADGRAMTLAPRTYMSRLAKNVSDNQRAGAHLGFPIGHENDTANQRPRRQSRFSIGPKNTNFVKDVNALLPVKFRLIPFSNFRAEVKNV